MAVSVEEASAAYQQAMRPIAPPGPGICRVCRGFTNPDFDTCYPCGHQPDNLEVVVPITYSEHLGQIHLALRNYKDGSSDGIRRYAAIRLAAILWRFLEAHESCVAQAAGAVEFDQVAIVPSSDPERDKHSAFAQLTGWVEPIKSRLLRPLEPTGKVERRGFAADRFRSTADLTGSSVLLLDDTWVTGGNAQSAAGALIASGAERVGLVAIGRHFHSDHEPIKGSGETCGDLLDGLPSEFSWETCAVHGM
ncbi:MAG TPA: hypothetical protein VFP21_00265 [Solirubrobacterales bacterium]|nr:hypothetical protein [Solirubrobacterales bacterium]